MRFPLTFFFGLAYLLSWWSIPFGGLIPHGPLLAALVMLALTEGRGGLALFWRRFAHWRVGWQWYLIAPGIVIAYHAVAFVINLWLGARVTPTAQMQGWQWLLALWPLLLLGGQWEEPGWTAYALPRLHAYWAKHAAGAIIGTLVLGVMRGLWHLPLVVAGHIPWYDMLFLSLALQLIIAWLYTRTQGSLPVVMLFHLTSNVAGALVPQLFVGDDLARHSFLFVAVACLFAAVLQRTWWGRITSRWPWIQIMPQ
jgi:hypothetical protein